MSGQKDALITRRSSVRIRPPRPNLISPDLVKQAGLFTAWGNDFARKQGSGGNSGGIFSGCCGGTAHRDARRGEAEPQPASLRQGDKPCKLAVQFREVKSYWSFRNRQKMRLRHSCGCLSLTPSRTAHPEAPCICALRVTAQTNVNLIYVIIVMYTKLNIVKNRVYDKLINVKTSSMTLQIGI